MVHIIDYLTNELRLNLFLKLLMHLKMSNFIYIPLYIKILPRKSLKSWELRIISQNKTEDIANKRTSN